MTRFLVIGAAVLVTAADSPVPAQGVRPAVDGCCNTCQAPPTRCTCTSYRPVVQTRYRRETCLTTREVCRTRYRTETYCENIPCVGYRNVCETVWVPKTVTRRVPYTYYRQRQRCRTVPYQTIERVPHLSSKLVPEQSVHYVPQTRTFYCPPGQPGGCCGPGGNCPTGTPAPPAGVPSPSTRPAAPPAAPPAGPAMPSPNEKPMPDPKFKKESAAGHRPQGGPPHQWGALSVQQVAAGPGVRSQGSGVSTFPVQRTAARRSFIPAPSAAAVQQTPR